MDVYELLKKYNQEHLLSYIDELTEDEKNKLFEDINSIDFQKMAEIYNNKDVNITFNKIISSTPYIDKSKLSESEINKFELLGDELIKKDKLAVCSMAGGQGTRLGHNGPKGTFIVELASPKSIFEIQVDKLKEAYKKYGVYINWYIMTSETNDNDTQKFFTENNFWGYPREYVTFFKQGELPLMDFSGKMILESKYKVFKAADGNGGIFEALYNNKILENMKNKGIEYLSVGNLDNILIKQVDSLLLGMMYSKGFELACKSVVKRSPEEPVGVFCKLNNRPSVIEYIDLDKEKAYLKDDNGELVYGEAHFGNNLLSRTLLEKIAKQKLPFHVAKKKNNYLGNDGNMIIASEPNTYKFEAFIFDGFEVADDMLLLRVKREEEFAPIKNKDGADSPKTAIELYNNYYSKNG